MNGWVKYFADGTQEDGWDQLVDSGHASWSRGRLEDIVSVQLFHGKMMITLEGTGEFWQSDTFEARMLVNEGALIKRTLMKRLHDNDNWLLVTQAKGALDTMVVGCKPDVSYFHQLGPCTHAISLTDKGRWLIVDMEQNGKLSWRIGDR